ncbi:MAG TPA: hypothetical protein VMK42_16960 [Anaeromyxobacteraceae bacterium]|nr:hypothetical protein [Anaeromyxobacteraceae bacterium]
MKASVLVAAACLWALPTLGEDIAATAEAPKPAPCPEEPSHRELAGHLFLTSHLTTDPFSYTAFGANFGLGAGQAQGPTGEFSNTPPYFTKTGTKWYGYSGLVHQFLLDVRILEYLSVHLDTNAQAYLGTGRDSIIVVGTSVGLAATLGVKGSLPIGEHVRLSLGLDGRYGPAYTVLLLNGIQDAINSCKAGGPCNVDPGQFLQESDTITWVGTLSAAWAPWPFLGLVGDVSYLNPRKTGTASYSNNGFDFAASVEFDAMPLLHWLPLGVNGGYAILTPVGANGVATETDYEFGIYYTGKRDLALGIEIDWQNGRLNNAQVQTSTLAWVNFKYYW